MFFVYVILFVLFIKESLFIVFTQEISFMLLKLTLHSVKVN